MGFYEIKSRMYKPGWEWHLCVLARTYHQSTAKASGIIVKERTIMDCSLDTTG